MTKYLVDFNDTFKKYCSKEKRPGYAPTLFSWFRHSNTWYPHIIYFGSKLLDIIENDADSQREKDIKGRQALVEYFQSKKTTFNNHSFSIYLLDILVTKYPDEKWEQFYPQEKKIVYYTGTLYRGTLQRPGDAFNHGIKPLKTSGSIEKYADHSSMSTGVSTSKSQKIADDYSVTTYYRGKEAPMVSFGYTYKINYRGKGGIDIIETLKARGQNFLAWIAGSKEEVNIVGGICKEDIEGYYYRGNEILHVNPNYKQDRPFEAASNITQSERLQLLFQIPSQTLRP